VKIQTIYYTLKTKSSLRLLVGLLAACLGFSGCGDTIKGKSIAEPQVAVFHERLDAARYEEIYTTANEAFRNSASKEKAIQLFSAIERKLGKVKSSSTKKWNTNSFNFVTRVVLVVDTQFEKGNGTETFTFVVSDEKATLMGYNINSLDMMTL